jgi:protein-disulfide isomerase
MARRKEAKRGATVRPQRTLAFLAILAAVSGGAAACKDSSGGAPGEPQATAATTPEVKEVVLPGVDTSAMTPRERREFSSLVSDLFAPCTNVPVPLATCVLDKRPCAQCLPASKFIAHAVRAGASEGDIERAYKERFDPSGQKTIPLAGSPTRGPDDAPVTVVELADFECPHCRLAVPQVDAMMAAHPDKVRLVYKFVVLSMHVHADPAARAAWAAGQQGKFWEMEHLLFERQDHLEQADLERYATILRLDLAKFKTDMDSDAAKDRLAQDKKVEDDLKLEGTPTFYVNGREVQLEADETLEERVAAELGVPPAGAPSASAAPSGSAAPPAPGAPSAGASSAPAPSAKPH